MICTKQILCRTNKIKRQNLNCIVSINVRKELIIRTPLLIFDLKSNLIFFKIVAIALGG